MPKRLRSAGRGSGRRSACGVSSEQFSELHRAIALSSPGVTVTNARDKELQLPKILKLDALVRASF